MDKMRNRPLSPEELAERERQATESITKAFSNVFDLMRNAEMPDAASLKEMDYQDRRQALDDWFEGVLGAEEKLGHAWMDNGTLRAGSNNFFGHYKPEQQKFELSARGYLGGKESLGSSPTNSERLKDIKRLLKEQGYDDLVTNLDPETESESEE